MWSVGFGGVGFGGIVRLGCRYGEGFERCV